MKDASKQRRSFGKLGILAAAAVILPLTATIVPAINAHDETVAPAADAKPVIKKKVKVIRIGRDGKTVNIIGNAGDGKEITKVERDGKTFIFRTDEKLSQDEVEAMIERAQESHEAADEAWTEAFEARIEADAARTEADVARGHADSARVAAAHARAAADVGRREAIRVMSQTDFASYIPEIDIKEITKNCKQGQPVTTNVHGFDGQNKSTIKIVMCGKGQAKVARIEALEGLREARSEIASEEDMPETIRKDVIEKLEKQIRKLEAEADKAG